MGPVFGGHPTLEHRGQVTAWWAEVMGGPSRYTEELGGYEQMLAKHRGLQITSEQRLRKRSALMAYAERGSRLAVQLVG